MSIPLSHPERRTARSSFALISTLIVLAILTVGVTAFLSKMRIERMAAQHYRCKTQAAGIADTGVVEALQRLEHAERRCLATAYVLNNLNADTPGSSNAPYLVALEPNATLTGWRATHHLFSSPIAAIRDGAEQKAPFDTALDELGADGGWADINAADPRHSAGGWMGLTDPADPQRPRRIPVPWLYVRDMTSALPRPPVVGRYAFWMDDESAKLDMLVAGRDAQQHEHLDGATPEELSLHELFPDEIATLRQWMQQRLNAGTAALLFTPRSWLNLLPEANTNSFETRRAALTLFSRADERGTTPGGMENQDIAGYRRLEITDFVSAATNLATPEQRAAVAGNTRHIAAWITNGIPAFGQRYYARPLAGGASGVGDEDAWRYTVKIAANIHDYIDADAQPTVLSWDTSRWVEVDDPDHYALPELPPGAFGIEAVPNVQDYLGLYMRNGASLTTGHKFEIWNLHARPIETARLGKARILMKNRAQAISPITGGSPAPIPGTVGAPQAIWSASLPANISVPPGAFAILSTLDPAQPNYRADRDRFGDRPSGIAPDALAYHRITNSMDMPRPFPAAGGASRGFRILGSVQNDGSDAITEISLINDYGYLFLQPRINQYAGATGTLLRMNDNPPQDQVFVPGTLFGNDAPTIGANTNRRYPLDSGDPRSFNHYGPQWDPAPGTFSPIATRRTQAQRSSANPPQPLAFGEDSCTLSYGINTANSDTLPADEMLPEPALVPHIYGTTNALSVLRDGRMRSIGELGHIYDPALPGAGYTSADCLNRGGFRTLAIGTRLGEGTSGNNALAHVTAANRADLLLELFISAPTTASGTQWNQAYRGRININSALRDPRNIPLRALVQGLCSQTNQAWNQTNAAGELIYPSAQDPSLGDGASINPTRFVDALVRRMTNASDGGPFMTLGELARQDIMNEGSSLLDTVNLTHAIPAHNNHLDRGREEIFRRISNLICLKGSVFTLYLVAESGTVVHGRFVPQSRCRREIVVETVRDYPAQDPLAELDIPELRANNRPTHVRTRILRSQTY